jgi:spore maturation protein CgeB
MSTPVPRALRRLRVVVFGLSLSSSWGNGHATTYRALLRAFCARGHEVLFLEHDQPWYAGHRDLANPAWCRLAFYTGARGHEAWASAVAAADAVIVGSYVPEGRAVGRFVQATAGGVTAFYDIDTPVTLAALERGDCAYLDPGLVPGFDVYLSFSGGPSLERLERRWGSPAARALYCSVDTQAYAPRRARPRWDLSYLGTYSPDRQPTLERLLVEPARQAPHLRFAVAGPLYPDTIDWPANVERLDHVGPVDHPAFYAASRWTLNVTRADMVTAGYSPSVRLFEAAACATPILSDPWNGLDTIFRPGRDLLLPRDGGEVVDILQDLPESRRRAIGLAGARRVRGRHDAATRASELERHLLEACARLPENRREARDRATLDGGTLDARRMPLDRGARA